MSGSCLKLGVNIDHVASLRQSRKTSYPDVVEAARICEEAGADGITVHLREDRRHIQDVDVMELRRRITTPLNLEMANHPEILIIALKVRPAEVCLVPERREELTTEGGLDAAGQKKSLERTVRSFADAGIDVSLFIEPDDAQIDAAAELRVPTVELHTGTFCNAGKDNVRAELSRLIRGAEQAHSRGLRVNAGHGISMHDIHEIMAIPYLDTLNIGHSIISRAIFIGLSAAVREMKDAMARYPGGVSCAAN